jgi:hypothetical protein
MVRGAAMDVSAVSGTYQWADMLRIALGLKGSEGPMADQPAV